MKEGAIYDAARRDGNSFIYAGLFLLGVGGAILGYNWKYVYNWCGGPFVVNADLIRDPGPREFVRASGELERMGIVESQTFKFFGGAIENTSVAATFYTMKVGGKLLIVKVDPEFAGGAVEGHLVDLPLDVAKKLDSDDPDKAYHPFLLDAERTSYRWDFNLFVVVAAPAAMLGLLILTYGTWTRLNVERHSALSRLKSIGTIASVVSGIESAMATATAAGPVWISTDWLVSLEPHLVIYSSEELVGASILSTVTKSGEVEHKLYLWSRDRFGADTIDVVSSDGQGVMRLVAETFPWAVIEDGEEYRKRFVSYRDACIREADARKDASAR